MGNFNLKLVCSVVRPVALDVLPLLCVILYYYLLPSFSLRLLLLSIAISAVDLDDHMVFSLI